MATKCIDISENKKLGTTSPIAMFAFVAIFIGITALMEVGFMYLIVLIVAFVFTQIFFQYKPRYIFLTMRFLTKNSYLTPSFNDPDYLADETKIPQVVKVLNEYEYEQKKLKIEEEIKKVKDKKTVRNLHNANR